MADCQWHSIIDAAFAFFQVPVADDTKELLAFTTPFGVFEWNRMPFGVRNGPSTQQAFLTDVLEGLGQQYGGYIDDMRASSKTDLDHICDLKRLFMRLLEKRVSLNLDKCDFFKTSIKFMGYIVSRDGIRPDPNRLKALKVLESPKNRSDLQSVLGMLGFCRKFIPGYSTIARPLFWLTKKDVSFEWTDDCENALRSLLSTLCDKPAVLHYPVDDCKFVVFTDGSTVGLSACLTQRVMNTDTKEWEFKTISWDSRSLRGSEQRYSPTDLEALAVVWAVGQQYRTYLLGRPLRST
jgi:hypothetical protein